MHDLKLQNRTAHVYRGHDIREEAIDQLSPSRSAASSTMFTKAVAAAVFTVLLLTGAALGMGVVFPAYFCGDGNDCFTKSCAEYSPIVSQYVYFAYSAIHPSISCSYLCVQRIQAHPTVHIYTIINPDNGPMSTSDLYPNYATCIPNLKNAGSSSTVLGYISTKNGKRAVEDVEADIDTYASWPTSYRPTGIFFDEVSDTAAKVAQYTSYATYARNQGFSFVCVLFSRTAGPIHDAVLN